MSAVTRSVAGFPTGVFPQLRDWIVVAGRSEQRRDDYPECDRMTSSTDAQEMAESGVAAHALLFEPLTLHDLTIKNRTWLSLMCQHMVTVEDGVGIQGAAMAIQLAHAGRDASMYRGFPAEPEGYVQPADEGWTTVGPSAVAYPGAPCATCADHRGDRRRRAGVRRRCPAL